MKRKESGKGWVRYYFKRLWWKVLITAILMGAIIVAPIIWENENKFVSLLLRFDAIAITAMFMTILSVILNVTYELLNSRPKYRKTPLKGMVQIIKIKLMNHLNN